MFYSRQAAGVNMQCSKEGEGIETKDGQTLSDGVSIDGLSESSIHGCGELSHILALSSSFDIVPG